MTTVRENEQNRRLEGCKREGSGSKKQGDGKETEEQARKAPGGN